MTEEQWRAPAGVRATTPDLFGSGERPIAPAPSFEARAAIWRDFSAGLLSFAEAQRRSAKIGALDEEAASKSGEDFSPRPRAGRSHPPAPRPRHSRPAPNASRQYSNPIATTAMRDDRLTPGARALLVVLRARCGKGRVTDVAKGTLAAIMSRSKRTIRRYLVDLERFGYILTEIRTTGQGFHTGLIVSLTEKVLPFWSEAKGLARWLGESAMSKPFLPFAIGSARESQVFEEQGVTLLSSKNQARMNFYNRGEFGYENGIDPGPERPR